MITAQEARALSAEAQKRVLDLARIEDDIRQAAASGATELVLWVDGDDVKTTFFALMAALACEPPYYISLEDCSRLTIRWG